MQRLLVSEVRTALSVLERGECGFNDEQTEAAFRAVQYFKTGVCHFTEETARGCIAQMYYYVGETDRRFAPYFQYDEMRSQYEDVASEIPDYNEWDFYVTMNLVYSNHHELIEKWTRKKDDVVNRVCLMAVSFLNDVDTRHPTDKIWWYMNC